MIDEINAVTQQIEVFVPVGDAFGAISTPGYSAELNVQVQALLLDGNADNLKAAMDAWWANR